MAKSTPAPRKGRAQATPKPSKSVVASPVQTADWNSVVSAVVQVIYAELRPYAQPPNDTAQRELSPDEQLAYLRELFGQTPGANGPEQSAEMTQIIREVHDFHDNLGSGPEEREQDSTLTEIHRIGEVWAKFLAIESDFRAGKWNQVAVGAFRAGWLLGCLNSNLRGIAALKGARACLGELASKRKKRDKADSSKAKAIHEIQRRMAGGAKNKSAVIMQLVNENRVATDEGKKRPWPCKRLLDEYSVGIESPKTDK